MDPTSKKIWNPNGQTLQVAHVEFLINIFHYSDGRNGLLIELHVDLMLIK